MALHHRNEFDGLLLASMRQTTDLSTKLETMATLVNALCDHYEGRLAGMELQLTTEKEAREHLEKMVDLIGKAINVPVQPNGGVPK